MDIKKIMKGALGLLALLIVLDALAFFIILFAPGTPFSDFLSRHEPIFNLLKQRIQSPDGYIIEQEIPSGDYKPSYQLVEGKHHVKIGPGIPVYSSPSRKSKRIRITSKDYNLVVVEENGPWLKVKFPFGSAWVNPDILYAGNSSRNQNSRVTSDNVGIRESRKTEWESRPDSSYFDFLHVQQRPLMFDELADDANPVHMENSSSGVNLRRLRKVTAALGNDFIQKKAGQFIIRGKDKRLVRDTASLLYNFKQNYSSVFKPLITDPKVESMIYVYILPDVETYKKFYPSGSYEMEKTSGHYELGIIVTYPDKRHRNTLRVLVHEATHHFNHLYLNLEDTANCTWLDEGLATYIGLSGFTNENKLKPGALNLYMAKKLDRRISTATPEGMAFYLINKVRDGKELELERVLYAHKQDFYSVDSVFNYAVAWSLVHFLLHAESGGYREDFFDFLKQAQLGNHSPQQLEDSIGLELKELEKRLRNYILKLDR